MNRAQLRLVGAETVNDIAAEIRAALVSLERDEDKGSGFVVTHSGVLWVRADPRDPTTFHLRYGDDARPAKNFTPHWDGTNRVLSFGGQIIRRYGRSSPNQETVLRAFQEQDWPYRIDDPLPHDDEVVPKLQLHDTIRWLNQKQECRLLRFQGDGTGEGVCWKPVAKSGLILHCDSANELHRAA
jgi:hypothetical protein